MAVVLKGLKKCGFVQNGMFFIRTSNSFVKKIKKEVVEVLNMVDGYELRHPHTWAGEVDIEGDSSNSKNKPHKIGCGLLMHQLVFLPNGDVSVCCVDLNSKGVVGNINKDNLFDIYNSKLRRSWLELMFKRRKSE